MAGRFVRCCCYIAARNDCYLSGYTRKSMVSTLSVHGGFVCKSRSRVSYFVYVQIIVQVHHKHIKLCIVFIYKYTVRQRYGFI